MKRKKGKGRVVVRKKNSGKNSRKGSNKSKDSKIKKIKKWLASRKFKKKNKR